MTISIFHIDGTTAVYRMPSEPIHRTPINTAHKSLLCRLHCSISLHFIFICLLVPHTYGRVLVIWGTTVLDIMLWCHHRNRVNGLVQRGHNFTANSLVYFCAHFDNCLSIYGIQSASNCSVNLTCWKFILLISRFLLTDHTQFVLLWPA